MPGSRPIFTVNLWGGGEQPVLLLPGNRDEEMHNTDNREAGAAAPARSRWPAQRQHHPSPHGASTWTGRRGAEWPSWQPATPSRDWSLEHPGVEGGLWTLLEELQQNCGTQHGPVPIAPLPGFPGDEPTWPGQSPREVLSGALNSREQPAGIHRCFSFF